MDRRFYVGGGIVILFGIVLLMTHNKVATGQSSVSTSSQQILVPSATTDSGSYPTANGFLPMAGLSSHATAGMGSLPTNNIPSATPGPIVSGMRPFVQPSPGSAIASGGAVYEPLGLPAAQPTILGV